MMYFIVWKPDNPDDPGPLSDRLRDAMQEFFKNRKVNPTGLYIDPYESGQLGDEELDELEAMGLDITWTVDVHSPNIGVVP